MSKEYIEALERLYANVDTDTDYYFVEASDDYNTVNQALQCLESIDNSKPSEALKYVNGKIADLEDDLQHYTMVDKDKCREFYIREDLKQFTNIKQALLKAQEQEKALSIIKEKRVITDLLIGNNLERYNYEIIKFYGNYGWTKECFLTQEEFDLLKRWLG